MSTPMGRRTYLGPKGMGDNSMFGKRMNREAVKRLDPQDSSDMAKADLPESQGPVNQSSWSGRTAVTPTVPTIPELASSSGKDIAQGLGGSEPPQGSQRGA